MPANTVLLNAIYQDTQMAITTLPQLISMTQHEAFKKCLEDQLKEYQKMNHEAQSLLCELGEEAKEVSIFAKMNAFLSTELKTMKDPSVSHIAEMMIQGNTMGFTTITRQLHENEEADDRVKQLGNRLLETTEANTEQMKKYL